MNTRVLDSSAKRVSLLVAVLTVLILLGAAAYTFLGGSPNKPVNGGKIIAAAHAYTRSLREQKLPIPPVVPLQELVKLHFLKPEDVGFFQGMDATVTLLARDLGPQTIVMRVHTPDGSDIALLTDGSIVQIKK